MQGAGNDPDENGVGHLNEGHLRDLTLIPEVATALRENKLIFVAGYDVVDGQFVRHQYSVSCEGAEDYCLYAPFIFEAGNGIVAGTSFSVPQVAAALASVLAVFPDTEYTELAKLARVCAVSESGLDGLGRADFTCMTVMDDNGEWRVVGVGDVISPMAMQSMRFPGRASMSGTFDNNEGESVQLGLTSLGTFDFIPGVPVMTEESVTGFFPVLAGDEKNHVIGIGFANKGGWFSRVAYGQRDNFFGLGAGYGYTGSTSLDADFGHRSLFTRVSWQLSNASRLIREAEGVALGFGAQRDVYTKGGLTVNLAANTSRFLGGSADTVFGPIRIEQSQWNREVAAKAIYAFSDLSSMDVAADYHQSGSGNDDVGIKASLNVRF